MKTLVARATYNDWDGTVAADSVEKGLAHVLEKKGLLNRACEFVVGVELSVPESGAIQANSVSVTAFVVCTASYDDAARPLGSPAEPLPLKTIELAMSLSEFISLFRQFNLVLTRRGLRLNGREIEIR